ANIDRWMDAQQTVLNRPMGVVFWGLVRTPADQRDPAAIAQGVADAAPDDPAHRFSSVFTRRRSVCRRRAGGNRCAVRLL
ncbi:MAG: hypothetical protein ACLPWG_03660, partial [Steroidobacteraceae bacterium]